VGESPSPKTNQLPHPQARRTAVAENLRTSKELGDPLRKVQKRVGTVDLGLGAAALSTGKAGAAGNRMIHFKLAGSGPCLYLKGIPSYAILLGHPLLGDV